MCILDKMEKIFDVSVTFDYLNVFLLEVFREYAEDEDLSSVK